MDNLVSDYLKSSAEIFYYEEKNEKSDKSETKLNVFIPCLAKDFIVLPYLIQSVRKNRRNKIKKISIVAPYSLEIEEICQEEDCEYISADAKIPFTKKNITLQALKHIRKMKKLN